MTRSIVIAGLMMVLLAGAAQAAPPAYLTKAVADPKRPAADTSRDPQRLPAELMEFAGIRPGMTVVDLLPGAGYFTRIFSNAVGPKGHVYAYFGPQYDERLIKARHLEEVSLGDFVLSGGEPAAIALLDAVIRLLPGVVGDAATLDEESFQQGLLEYPHYTRPQDWQGRAVPDVLLSGHHENIRRWRMAEAERVTRERRPDLWQQYLARPGRP